MSVIFCFIEYPILYQMRNILQVYSCHNDTCVVPFTPQTYLLFPLHSFFSVNYLTSSPFVGKLPVCLYESHNYCHQHYRNATTVAINVSSAYSSSS